MGVDQTNVLVDQKEFVGRPKKKIGRPKKIFGRPKKFLVDQKKRLVDQKIFWSTKFFFSDVERCSGLGSDAVPLRVNFHDIKETLHGWDSKENYVTKNAYVMD